jgi:hypothetical protein
MIGGIMALHWPPPNSSTPSSVQVGLAELYCLVGLHKDPVTAKELDHSSLHSCQSLQRSCLQGCGTV